MNCMTTIYEADLVKKGGHDLNITGCSHYEGYDDSVRYFISVFDFDVADEIEVVESTEDALFWQFLTVLERYKAKGWVEQR